MTVQLTDAEIQFLVGEPKPLQHDYRTRIKTRPKRGHSESELDLTGTSGSEFRLIIRQSEINPLDFSIILAHRVPNSNQLFRLRRYNGKHGEHTNTLEGQTFYDFHIHEATERYQDSGLREDAFAQATDRYVDLASAVECLISDCAFQAPPDQPLPLFDRSE